MTKIKNNPLLKGASGMLGGTIVYRQLNGEVIMANPPTKIPITPHQLETKLKFLQAVTYAKVQMAKPDMKALYTRKITGKNNSAYSVARTDALNPPVINAIHIHNYNGEIGSRIVIDATDDFEVESVVVKIFNENFTLIEEGNASKFTSNDLWYYKATVNHTSLSMTKIVAVAKDRPGNVVTREVVLPPTTDTSASVIS